MEEKIERDPNLMMLVGRELAFVTFVRNYIQFGFDGPILNAFTDPVLRVDNKILRCGDPSYNNEMIGVINKTVKAASAEDEGDLELVFQDDITISISLRAQDLKGGPEAAVLFLNMHGGSFSVWPAGRKYASA